MITVSNDFKNGCNSDVLTYREYIVIDNQTIDIKGTLNTTAYKDTTFFGTFNMKTLEFETENDVNFKQKEFVYFKEVNGESMKVGTFITQDVNDNDTKGTVKVLAYDYGLKFAIPYVSMLNYESGEITLDDVIDEICSVVGVQRVSQTLPNGSFIVDSNQFVNQETNGDVIVHASIVNGMFATINNDDKLVFRFITNTGEIIEDYEMLEDKRDTHQLTCLCLAPSKDLETLGATRKDLTIVNEENWLKLYDYAFAYSTEKCEQLIDNIFNLVKGFGYSSFEGKYAFKPYLELGDKIQFKNKSGQLIDSVVLRTNSVYDDMTISAPSIISASVEYQIPETAKMTAMRAYIEANREQSTITSIVARTGVLEGTVDTITDNVDTLTQTVNGLTNTVSSSGGTNYVKDSMGVLNDGSWLDSNDNKANMQSTNYSGAVGQSAIVLNNTLFKQSISCKNGVYNLSFKFLKNAPLGVATIVVNDTSYTLDSTGEFSQNITVSTNTVDISFVGNVSGTGYIYDLMLNEGTQKKSWEQNQDETTTETVKIGKGIEVRSSTQNTTSKMNADGFKVTSNTSGDDVMKATDKGGWFNELESHSTSKINGSLFIRVGNQTWETGVDV